MVVLYPMKLTHMIIRRLVLQVFVLFGLSVITFVISHVLPTDPIRLMMGAKGGTYSPILYETLRKKWGLDRPLYEQYVVYMTNLFHGDLGTSIHSKRPVMTDLMDYFPATFELAIFAMIISFSVAIVLGVISARYKDKLPDNLVRLFSLFGISMPVFWIGLLSLAIMYYRLGWVGPGRISIYLEPPTRITNLFLLDSILTGNWTTFVDSLQHIILPALVLGFESTAMITRITRGSMLDVLSQDYIRTAHAKGLSERVVYYKHALKNALIPVSTVVGLGFGWLLGGSVLVETIFNWPGLGRYVVHASLSSDFMPILGVTLFIALIFTTVNLIVDLAYYVLDPRIRR
jgi:peptide/nickel transport system permease protein